MIRVLLTVLLVWTLFLPATAQQTGVEAEHQDDVKRRWFEVTMQPEAIPARGGWIGEEIILDVHFVSSDPFTRLRLELPEIEGAKVDTLVRPHTLQINMFGGRGYSHQTRLAIVPTEAGTLTIPEIRVTGVAQQRNGRNVEFEEIHPTQEIAINAQPADYGGAIWIAPHQVSIEESWSSDIDSLKVGDTIRRTVVLDAVGVRADDLYELVLESNDGYRVLSHDVETETIRTPKGYGARLTQSWDLYIETDEIAYIDAVHFPYWDTEAATTVVAQVPRQRVEPILRDATELRDRLREEALQNHQVQRFGLIVLLALPITALVIAIALGIWHALPTRADLRLKRSVREARSPIGFYPSFQDWGRETFGIRRPVEQARLSELGDDARARSDELNASIFARGDREADVAGTAAALVRAARRKRVAGYLSAIGPAVSKMLFLK